MRYTGSPRRVGREGIGRALMEACGSAALYLGMIGGMFWKVAEAAGYLV